jgi:hypothetical protein
MRLFKRNQRIPSAAQICKQFISAPIDNLGPSYVAKLMTSRQTIDFFCLRLGRKMPNPKSTPVENDCEKVNVIWIPLDMPQTADIEKWRVLPAEERHLFSKSLYNSNKVS